MIEINSVLGPLNTSKLGFTLMHEHLIGCATGILQNYPELLGPDLMDRLVADLKTFKKEGINTILDASTYYVGRNVRILSEASSLSGVNILTATGWHYKAEDQVGNNSPDKLAALFIRETRQGIEGTDIKPAVLKAYADKAGVTPGMEIAHRAVARAHLATGLPIILHSFAQGEVGRRQLAILLEEGINMARVKIDHCLDTTNLDYLTWLLDQGVFLGMERCPVWNQTVEDMVKTLEALIDKGWANRLMPSHDHLLIRYTPELPPKLQEHLISNCDVHKLLYFKKVMFPKLIEAGVPEKTLISMFTDNPRCFFEVGRCAE
jgi:phosphotriesterase-related protein